MVIFRKDRQIQRKDIVSARNASPAAHFSRSCCVFLQFVAKSLYQEKRVPGSMHCPGSAKRFPMEDGGPVPREKRFGQEAGKDMKYTIGITSWCWPDFSSAAFPRIKNAGFDTLQLEVGSWEDGLPLSKREIRKEYAEAAAGSSLLLLPVAVNTVCRHPFTEGLDTPDGAIALKALDAGVEAAAEMGAGGITVPNFGRNKILDPAGRENTLLALRHACQYAMELGINVYTENLLPAGELGELFRDCSYANLYLLFDSHNYILHSRDCTMDVLRSWYGRIGSHLHVKAGSGLQSAPLSGGNCLAGEVLAFLKEKDYAGSIVLENDYSRPPLFSDDLRFMLDDIGFIRRHAGSGSI